MSAYEAVLQKLKRNRVTAAILVLGVAVIAIGQVTGALKTTWEVISDIVPDGPAYTLDDDAFRRGESQYALGHDTAAAEAFRESAYAGNPLAAAALARMHFYGLGVLADREWARHWAGVALKDLKSLSEDGEAGAQYYLGSLYDLGVGVEQDDARAVELFKTAAFQNQVRAQNALGWMYDIGEGVAEDDVEAVKWYRLAAERGDPKGQTNLGWMYESGQGVVQDKAEAAKWYRLAADQGDPRGQTNLGWMYANGEGVAQDRAEAVEWFQRAAEQSYGPAQHGLGCSYAQFRGALV